MYGIFLSFVLVEVVLYILFPHSSTLFSWVFLVSASLYLTRTMVHPFQKAHP